MKKVFDQTVRDLKREVNKKVLKVPGIEQKVLDATSNEPWGPHGSKMADIADATRNFHEYQMIMGVLWKRANDTGKNWRHVYKALTVLEYLVGHGSERVIDELREHAYQIQTLSDFQYVDSSGKDQGVNVRRKAQAIVALINDKERIREVRQKAAANRDKYRGGSSTGGIYKPSTYSSTGGGYGADQYDEDRYGNRYGGRDDDRNGYGRDREFEKYKDDDRYGRNSDSSSRDGDRYGRDRDGGDRDHEDERYNARRNDRSYDKEKDRAYEDYDRNGGRVDEYAPDDRYERKQSGGKWGAPPSYEESVNDSVHQHSDERDGGSLAATVANATTRLANKSQVQDASVFVENATNSANKGTDDFSDFNPRTSFTAAAPVSSSQTDVDFFGAPSEPLALPSTVTVLPTSTSTSETNLAADLFGDASFGPSFTAPAPALAPAPAPSSENQPGENPFGDPPFKVSSSSFEDPFSAQTQNTIVPATPSFSAGESGGSGTFTSAAAPNVDTTGSFGFMDSFQAGPSNPFGSIEQPVQSSNNTSIFQTQAQIQVPTQPQIQSQPQIQLPTQPQTQLPTQPQTQSQAPIQMQPHAHTHTQPFGLDFTQGQAISSVAFTKPQEQTTLQASQVQNAFATSNGKSQQKKEKFEPKSAIWADTLSRGLVDLNISGPKINPLADIGIDLDSISRLEKRRGEKERTSTGSMPSSSQPMGRAMGSGTGLGRAGAGALSTPAAPMVGSMGMGGYGMGMGASAGMGMGAGPNMGMGGMGMGPGAGMGMGPGAGMGMGMGMGMSMPMGPGMGMNPAMTMPGMGMRPPMGMPPGSGMGGVNPMMGAYGSQQQPYGGYR